MLTLDFLETKKAIADVIRAETREKLVANEAEFMKCSNCSQERFEELLKDIKKINKVELELLYKIDRENSQKERLC